MKRIWILTAALWLSPAGARAALGSSGYQGTSAADFLKIGAGARPAAMGGAFAAVADDAQAAYYDPAGLGLLKRPQVTGMDETRFAGLVYDYATVAVPLLAWVDTPMQRNAYGVAAFSFYSLSVGGIERRGTTETDQPVDTFGASDYAYALSYGYEFAGTGLALGGTAKFVDSTIDTTQGRAWAADGGALYRRERLSAAAGWRNMGSGQNFAGSSDPLPFTGYAGAGYRFSADLLVSAELDLPRDEAPVVALGAEYRRSFSRDLSAAARLGFNSSNTDPGQMAGMSLGFGLRYEAVDVDFAWLPAGELGDTFRYSLMVRF
jgi:hypothetical protein